MAIDYNTLLKLKGIPQIGSFDIYVNYKGKILALKTKEPLTNFSINSLYNILGKQNILTFDEMFHSEEEIIHTRAWFLQTISANFGEELRKAMTQPNNKKEVKCIIGKN